MPMMIPPHYEGLRYDGRRIRDGEVVPVADADVSSLLDERWELVEKPVSVPEHKDLSEDEQE